MIAALHSTLRTIIVNEPNWAIIDLSRTIALLKHMVYKTHPLLKLRHDLHLSDLLITDPNVTLTHITYLDPYELRINNKTMALRCILRSTQEMMLRWPSGELQRETLRATMIHECQIIKNKITSTTLFRRRAIMRAFNPITRVHINR